MTGSWDLDVVAGEALDQAAAIIEKPVNAAKLIDRIEARIGRPGRR